MLSSQPTEQFYKPHILIVDDHPPNIVALEAVLGNVKYNILTASSGLEALRILEQHSDVALVLLDVQMPEMDGYEVTRRVKSSAATKHIPIILVTAIFHEDPHVQRGYDAGAVDYFSKPFNPEVLKRKVGIYADLYQKNIVLRQKEEEQRRLELIYQNQANKIREEARRCTAELMTLLESVPDAVYVGDKNGITRCNRAALAMFGVDSCEQFNQQFENLAVRNQMRYSDSGKPVQSAGLPLIHALRGEQFSTQFEILHSGMDREVTVACAASPVILSGEIISAVVVNSDLSRDVQIQS